MEPTILQNQQKYEKNDQQVLETAITDFSEDIENLYREPVLPQIDHKELIDSAEGQPSDTYGCFYPSANNVSRSSQQPCSYDLGQDLGITRKQLDYSCLPLNEMNDKEYRILVQNLNHKQNEFFFNVYHWLKTKSVCISFWGCKSREKCSIACFVSSFTKVLHSPARRKP